MSLKSGYQIFQQFRQFRINPAMSLNTISHFSEHDSAEDTSIYDTADIGLKVKNPNSVVIRGDIFHIDKDPEKDHVRLTLKVRRRSVTRIGEPYIRSQYFNVNFYGVSDPNKNWKIPKYYAIGDNVSTYSNLCRVAYSDFMYLRGYAMRRHSQKFVATAETLEENFHPTDEQVGVLLEDDGDEISLDEMK